MITESTIHHPCSVKSLNSNCRDQSGNNLKAAFNEMPIYHKQLTSLSCLKVQNNNFWFTNQIIIFMVGILNNLSKIMNQNFQMWLVHCNSCDSLVYLDGWHIFCHMLIVPWMYLHCEFNIFLCWIVDAVKFVWLYQLFLCIIQSDVNAAYRNGLDTFEILLSLSLLPHLNWNI